MELGSQDIQELTGYIEEMFSEYMTFPTILFIVAIVVALSSIACFILAPFYIKGKARGAKTAAQVISVIDFIIGILLILAFIIITLLFNMASDGFFDSADEFLKAVLGFVDTTKHTYSDLSDEINLNTGGITLSVSSYADSRKQGAFTGIFTASARVLCEKLDFGFSAIAEILLDSILDDEKRLGEIVAETKSKSQMRLNQAAHSAAVMRASSYFSAESAFDDCTGGIGFYQFLEETAKHFEEKKGEVIAKLKETAARLGYFGLYTQGQDNNLAACLFYIKVGFCIGGFDSNVYRHTSQEEKADIIFYTECGKRERD